MALHQPRRPSNNHLRAKIRPIRGKFRPATAPQVKVGLGTRNFPHVLWRQFGRSLSHQCRAVLPLDRATRQFRWVSAQRKSPPGRAAGGPAALDANACSVKPSRQCLDGVDRFGTAPAREPLVPPLLNTRLRWPVRKNPPMNPRKFLVACLTLTVSVGCASLDQPNTSLGPFPTDFKTTIKKHVLRSFFDPYSIRDASISEPVGSRTGEPDGWLVCLETNAKNRMGGYTGLSRTAYYVRLGGQVVGLETGDYGNYSCSGRTLTGTRTLTFSPWPELEQLQHQ